MRITNTPPPVLKSHTRINKVDSAAEIESDFVRELKTLEAQHNREMAEISAESIGWTELSPGTYLHLHNEQVQVIDIVGIATASMVENNVLWLI